MVKIFYNLFVNGIEKWFNFKSLKNAYKLATSSFDKEHVTSFIWSNPQIFSVSKFRGKKPKLYEKNIINKYFKSI